MNIIIGIRAFYLGKLPETYYFNSVAFVLLILNIKLYQYPTILYGIKLGKDENQKKIKLVQQIQKKQVFDEGLTAGLHELIAELTASKEILQVNFSIETMAKQLDTSTHLVSKLLKEELNCNFPQLVSKSRIQILLDTTKQADFKKYSITGLIKLYGFKSIKQFKIDLEKYSTEEYDFYIAKMKNNG
jgi:YesN/AraC family two-component response regulator